MEKCLNCGHDCHCNKAYGHCRQTHKDGDSESVDIVCCTNCRHELKGEID